MLSCAAPLRLVLRWASAFADGDQNGALGPAPAPRRTGSAATIRPARVRITMPPSGPPPAGRTVTAAKAPLGPGYTASDTARRRGSPTSWLSSPAVASSTGGRPASRSTTVASGLFWSDTAPVGSGPVTAVNTPAAAGSPATWSPLPSETDRPVAIEITEMGLLDENVGSP